MATRISKFSFPIHVNISNFVTIKFAEDNFLLCEAHILWFLRSQELVGFVNGDATTPQRTIVIEVKGREFEEHNKYYIDWLRTDQLISSWISGAISKSILGLIIGPDTSYEI